MRQINYLHLFHFFVIAQESQLARAAKKLHVSQPTLSTQLRDLEESLGYRLFERKRGETIRLTDRGKIVYSYSKEIFRLGNEMLEIAQGLTAPESFHIRIGALDAIPKRVVYDVVSEARRAADCTFTIFEDSGPALVEGLAAHRFDLTIGNTPVPHRPDLHLHSKQIARIPVCICGARRFEKLRRGFPESLANQPFFLPTSDGKLRSDIENYFRIAGIRVAVLAEAQDCELLRLAALAGEAMVPLSRLTIDQELKSGALISVGEMPDIFEEIWIGSASRFIDHPVVNHLMGRRLHQAA